jgi:hypothetical protein
MKRVLLVGLDPATVDFSDPALLQGMNAEKIHAGVRVALADMAERGRQAENCFIIPDETAVPAVEGRLAEARYDCVVIGAGVRLPPSRLVLFEALVNAIHRAAPTRPSPSTPDRRTPARPLRAGSERLEPARTAFTGHAGHGMLLATCSQFTVCENISPVPLTKAPCATASPWSWNIIHAVG